MSFADTLRALGLGRIALHLYHNPVGRLRDSWREGGPIQQRRTERARQRMEAAAAALTPPASVPSGRSIELHLLTGRKYWYQTAFCLWTFAHHARRSLAPVLYDDGTLGARERQVLGGLFPAARFVGSDEIGVRLDTHLPAASFPHLRERRITYPHLRKLTDVHAGATGWKLVLDSDLLFFRRPDFLLEWLDQPGRPLHAVDVTTSYGFPRQHLEALAGAPLGDRVNVGLCGLEGSAIEWEKIESWCRSLRASHGTSYYLEQALVAMLVAGRPCAVAPETDYVTLPRPPEARACRAVMHHYVAESKRWYYQHSWAHALSVAGASIPSATG